MPIPRPKTQVGGPDATAVAQVGGAALVIYGTYRVIRMLPSLAPPLWWTIPLNAVAP
jgi:hypothetical protein